MPLGWREDPDSDELTGAPSFADADGMQKSPCKP